MDNVVTQTVTAEKLYSAWRAAVMVKYPDEPEWSHLDEEEQEAWEAVVEAAQ